MKCILLFLGPFSFVFILSSCLGLSDKKKDLPPGNTFFHDSSAISKFADASSLFEPLYLPVNGSVLIIKRSYGCFYYSREIMKVSRTVDSFHIVIKQEIANGQTLDSLKKSFDNSFGRHLDDFCKFYQRILNAKRYDYSKMTGMSTSSKDLSIKSVLHPVELRNIEDEDLLGYENLKLAVKGLSLR